MLRTISLDSIIPIPFGSSIQEVINCASKDKWFHIDGNSLFLLNDKGINFFKRNEQFLQPYKIREFHILNETGRFPTIMNYYDTRFHKDIKREYFQVLSKKKLSSFMPKISLIIEKWFSLKSDLEINLFLEINKLIIDAQMQVFFNLKLNECQLDLLSFYEDHYTLGIYIDNERKKIEHFKNERFIKAEILFKEIFTSNNFEKTIYNDFKNEIKKNSTYNTIDDFSHFYNFSVAGSTNIAKTFYLLISTLSDEIIKKGKNLYNENNVGLFHTLISNIILEVYRVFPISPYLIREVILDFALTDRIRIKKGTILIVMHTLNHFNADLFKEPLEINALRWEIESERINKNKIQNFGLGAHKCLGNNLSDLWIFLLLEYFLKNYKFNVISEPDCVEFSSSPCASLSLSDNTICNGIIKRNG